METTEATRPEAHTHAARTYEGACFCGAVKFTVTGEPAVMGYCHCDSCRSWSASPVNAFTLWKPDAIRVTQGAQLVETFHKTPRSYRKWCKRCGGHLYNEHPQWDLVDVYAGKICIRSGDHGLLAPQHLERRTGVRVVANVEDV